jgi:hypothetical protein
MMASDQWFEHFERVLAEHPEIDDETASEMAEERVRDENADRADYAKDLWKYDGVYMRGVR